MRPLFVFLSGMVCGVGVLMIFSPKNGLKMGLPVWRGMQETDRAEEQTMSVKPGVAAHKDAASAVRPADTSETGSGRESGPARPPANLSPVAMRENLEREKALCPALGAEVHKLSERIDELAQGDSAIHSKMFDFTQEELDRMAEKCELRWDRPFDRENPSLLGEEKAASLGIDDNTRQDIDRIVRDYHQEMMGQLEPLYTTFTGKKDFSKLNLSDMMKHVDEKAGEQELERVFRRLSAERAGLLAPPADLSQSSPAERIYRLVTGVGDVLERRMTGKLGAETAKNYRLHVGSVYLSVANRNSCAEAK